MKEYAHILLIVMGAATAMSLGGCANSVQRSAGVTNVAAAGETYTLYPPQAVLDTNEIAAYRQQRRQWADDGLVADQPWWAERNDARLNIRPGGNQAGFTDSYVYVHDRQYSSGGHISNQYRRDAYSRSYNRISE